MARLLPSHRDGETVALYLQTLAVSTCRCFGNLAFQGWIKSPKLYRLELSRDVHIRSRLCSPRLGPTRAKECKGDWLQLGQGEILVFVVQNLALVTQRVPFLNPTVCWGVLPCIGRVTGPFAFVAVQQKEVTQSPSTSTITLVTSTQPAALVSSSGSASTLASAITADLPIATASADVAADIAKYTSKVSGWCVAVVGFLGPGPWWFAQRRSCWLCGRVSKADLAFGF